MLKKRVFSFVVVLLLFLSETAGAVWKDIYAQVADAYIGDVTAEDLAVAALKGLHRVDKELTVANDRTYITLYYKGRVEEALRKPKEKNDVVMWGNLTEKIISKAVEVSTTEQDFRMEDILAETMISALDEDSKFYGSMDAAVGVKGKNHRVFVVREEDELLYINIKAFNKQTQAELVKALLRFPDTKAIVVDLRGCPGGMSAAAVKAADVFLSQGIIISIKGRGSAQEVYYPAYDKPNDERRPVFVLIDGKTASAAEIFASALQEQGRARIIGSQSKGKGTLQKLISLSGGGVLAVTSGFFKTPAGNVLNKKGITPDVCTFEQSETADVEDLMKKEKVSCSQEDRVHNALEMKIVQALMGHLFLQN